MKAGPIVLAQRTRTTVHATRYALYCVQHESRERERSVVRMCVDNGEGDIYCKGNSYYSVHVACGLNYNIYIYCNR